MLCYLDLPRKPVASNNSRLIKEEMHDDTTDSHYRKTRPPAIQYR